MQSMTCAVLAASGSMGVATVAAIRNLAGRQFSATSRYQDKLWRIAGSSQILKRAKSLAFSRERKFRQA
jgi:hypothetical protein